MPFADPERRRAYHRERQRRRRAAGLCAQCNQSVVDGQTRCVEHRGKADVGDKIRVGDEDDPEGPRQPRTCLAVQPRLESHRSCHV